MGRGRSLAEEPRLPEEDSKFALEPLPDISPKSMRRHEEEAQTLRECLADANLTSISEKLLSMEITTTRQLCSMSTQEISSLGLKKLSEKKLRAVIGTLHVRTVLSIERFLADSCCFPCTVQRTLPCCLLQVGCHSY